MDKEKFSLNINEFNNIDSGYRFNDPPVIYNQIEDIINSVDEEDGGYQATIVIQRLSDDKFFTCNYQGWEIEHNQGELFDFIEVEKKIKEIEYYE